jgi:hypothetical protein
MNLITAVSATGVESRLVRIGPMPRVRPGKTGVMSDIRMIQLTAEAIDWLPPDFRDAVTTESVLFSSMVPRSGSNRTLPEGHVQRENHDRLMIGLQEHPVQCVRQFGRGYNIDAIHLVTIYNALVTAVGNWDRDMPAVVVAPVDFSGQELVNADEMEAYMNEKRRLAYIDVYTRIRAAGYKMNHPKSSASLEERYVSSLHVQSMMQSLLFQKNNFFLVAEPSRRRTS